MMNAYLISEGHADDSTLEETWVLHEHEQKDFKDHCNQAKKKLEDSGESTIFGFEIAKVLVEEYGYIALKDICKGTYYSDDN